MKKISLPTGYLFTDEYSRGPLETLSIGDYGKEKNIKADFLGFTKEIDGVPNGYCKNLSEKWVITLSTQYGCPMKCTFCDVPKISFKGNATFDDLYAQFLSAIACFPSVGYTDRLNIHFARMGEPIFNRDVFVFAKWLYINKLRIKEETGLSIEVIHPVMTTSLPVLFGRLENRIQEWIGIKNNLYNGQAGLQFSINSTSEDQRDKMFSKLQTPLFNFSQMAKNFEEPVGRKYCLNFAYATGFEVDAKKLANLFDAEKFMVKITPIHNNESCKTNDIETVGGYKSYAPYRKIEEDLKSAGFDVLVFVPSFDEEDGLVTCGNVVLSGSEVKTTAKTPLILGI